MTQILTAYLDEPALHEIAEESLTSDESPNVAGSVQLASPASRSKTSA